MKLDFWTVSSIATVLGGFFLFFTPQGKTVLANIEKWYYDSFVWPNMPENKYPAERPRNEIPPQPGQLGNEWAFTNSLKGDWAALEKLGVNY